jgi:hypothetical protein
MRHPASPASQPDLRKRPRRPITSLLVRTLMPHYDSRAVTSHGDNLGPLVLLMNEAPGPSEATSGVPSFGQQGANIFHALRAAGISWAADHPRFRWPRNGVPSASTRHREKAAFLVTRAHHLTCTNAYPKWPKPTADSSNFCAPADDDVLSPGNLARIRNEVSPSHRVILICGRSAYLACIGEHLPHPASRERTELTPAELRVLNGRLSSQFEWGWYMGHTRRWSIQRSETARTLRLIATFVGWPVSANAG